MFFNIIKRKQDVFYSKEVALFSGEKKSFNRNVKSVLSRQIQHFEPNDVRVPAIGSTISDLD